MEKLIINKELLTNYKTLLVVLENCDVYEINVDDILDIYCVAEKIGKSKTEYRTKDGFIKIAAKAAQTIECSVVKNEEIGTELDYRLKERLEMCKGAADMTSFSLSNDKQDDLDIYVPYNPLEEILHGCEIDWSNCPSFETDKEGNMIIAFGERSKQPRRKDNNYAELVKGWTDAFGDFNPKVLKVKLENFSTFGENGENFALYFKICNKNCKKQMAEFLFMDCKNVSANIYFTRNSNCEIVMSKMANGQIYVGLWGLGMDFVCSSMVEYAYHCNRDEE